jgi:ribosomal protein S18 acetylase RimI-like enzyme
VFKTQSIITYKLNPSLARMSSLIGKTTLHSAYDRPDLVEVVQNPLHPLQRAWPAFVEQTLATKLYWKYLVTVPQLAIFQMFVTVVGGDETPLSRGREKVVARAHAVPFYRALRESTDPAHNDEEKFEPLPDGGWDLVLELGVAACLNDFPKPPANTLSALSITIDPAYRRQGLAEYLINTMKEKAQEAGLDSLVVPLRPTMKQQFPDVDMEVYARLTRDGGVLENWPRVWSKGIQPFDPWLRKHVSLGALMIKVAPFSMVVEADLQCWSAWTGVDIESRADRAIEEGRWTVDEIGQQYLAITVPGGMNKVRYFPFDGLLRYVESNIWVQYTW